MASWKQIIVNANNSVVSSNITDGAITANKIASSAINHPSKFDNGVVGADALGSNAVTTAKIAGGAVTAAKIASDAVGNAKIADNAVQSAQLANGSVSNGKIVNDAVSQAKIADNAVGAAQLIVTGTGNTSQFLRSDGDGTFSWATPSASVADSSITTAKLADNAVTFAKIQDLSIQGEKIADEGIVDGKLADDAVGSNVIQDNAVTFDKLSYTGQKTTGQALVYNQYVSGNIGVASFINTHSLIFTHNFSDDIAASTHYLPWSGTAEGTSINGSDVGITAPVNMTFRRLMFRSEWINATVTISFKFYKRVSGTTSFTLTDSTTLTYAPSEDHTVKVIEDGVSSSQINFAISKTEQAIVQLVANVDGTQFSDFGVSSIWSVDINDMDWG